MNYRQHSPRCTLTLRLSALLFGLLALSSAQALTFCVNSVALLETALSVSQFSSDANTIKIVQGTYLMDADMVYTFAAPTTIEGGYTVNCAARVVDAANTVINIGGQVNLVQPSASPQAQINVDGLTFSNANLGLSITAGQHHLIAANDEGSVTLSRVRFTQITSLIDVSAYSGSVQLENVLFDHISASGTCAVGIHSYSGASLTINHMTADLASGNDLCLTDESSQTQMFVYNSILWNSDGGNSVFRGTSGSTASVAFFNDIFHGQAIAGTTIFQSPIYTDPLWISPATGNYRLKTSPLSPGINSGTSLIFGGEPSTDIEGHLRTIGSLPDRGAYESAVSDLSVLTVTNTLDSGAGSLRQAMLDANSSPTIAKSIKFDIRGAGQVPICPAVIGLLTPLPAVASNMNIDGYTQPLSSKNTDPVNFNAQLCIMLKPASGTLLTTGLRIAAATGAAASLRLSGLGLGGFGQPLLILGGQDHLISGNQFGGVANGVSLPGAGLSTINFGVNAGNGSLIIGGINPADRNVIGGASNNGIDIQSGVQSTTNKCQIVNNLIGLTPNGQGQIANNIGINVSGSGCSIVGNRVAGNTINNIWLNGSSDNVVQQNQIGFTSQGNGFLNNAIGIFVTGSDNVIGASGNGGAITANTVRLMVAGGIVIQGNSAVSNSINANLVYENGLSGNGMDIDLRASSAATGPTGNDGGDSDFGPNFQQNFPVPTQIVYTAPGSTNRPAILSGILDTFPGLFRIDAYFSSSANAQRGHAEVFLGHANVSVGNAPTPFSLAISVPNQLPGGVISLTATDTTGNTSEIGTALSIFAVNLPDAVFANSFE